MAVLCSAAARGWTLSDVQAAIDAGRWAGLAALYSRPGEPGRMTRLLAAEYRRATGSCERNQLTESAKLSRTADGLGGRLNLAERAPAGSPPSP